MVSLEDYAGREQSYVKHIFLERYLEALVFKTASTYPHIVYVDGFAGPWQSANEQFEDTSFVIALNALRRAKEAWKRNGRNVRMSAFLVERDGAAYAKLTHIPSRYPDIGIKTYPADFLTVLSEISRDIATDAFAFFLIDPKGWRIPLERLTPLLARKKSEVIFNFLFDFINRAANIDEPIVVNGLNELMPSADWKGRLEEAERRAGRQLTSEERKSILVGAFTESLARLGSYQYVAETTVLRPLRDRPLYCLCYASRHERGIEMFRDCQVRALTEQSKARAATKIRHAASSSGQGEFFESLHDMGPDGTVAFLEKERKQARETLLGLTPQQPGSILYEKLWPQVLARHVVRKPDVNTIAVHLRDEGKLLFPDWERAKRVPQGSYRTQRP
jgi:three-Cys-motif partner protein